MGSVPIQQGWKLRVLSGTSLGREFDLSAGRYVLGSKAPSTILIPDPSIAPRHLTVDVFPDHVRVTDCSGGAGLLVNGRRVAGARVAPGDHVTVGTFKFEFSNPGWRPPPAAGPAAGVAARFARLPLYGRVGLVTFAVAALLYLLLVVSRAPTLVPVTLLAMSAVVPTTMICYLVEKHGRAGISFQTLTITFLAGGTIGVISAMLGFLVGGLLTGGLLLIPVFAGVLEEPAKLLATAWRWRHPGYDRPLDGLIIGTVSGCGFAVFETAGYGFTVLAEGRGLAGLLETMVLRAVTAPFGHGLWSGILAAAFWQCGRDLRRAVRDRVFFQALAWSVGLHALWNAAGLVPWVGFGFVVCSASLSVWQYRLLLARKGYRP
jgi:RsiW-degrading membrane proteinase PrsW (M82 family)